MRKTNDDGKKLNKIFLELIHEFPKDSKDRKLNKNIHFSCIENYDSTEKSIQKNEKNENKLINITLNN